MFIACLAGNMFELLAQWLKRIYICNIMFTPGGLPLIYLYVPFTLSLLIYVF